jgi:hypothetical protein
MKKIILISSAFLIMLFNACEPKPLEINTAKVTLHFNNMVGSQMIAIGAAPSYITDAGQKYNVELLKYYISGVRLIDDAGKVKTVPGYHLIDAGTNGKLDIEMGEITDGNYTQVQFNMGLDSAKNIQSYSEGDLDVSNGMYWSWLGYIFFKHEGKYLDNNNLPKGLRFHLGTNAGFIGDIKIPIPNNMNVAGIAKTINVNFDLNKAYVNGYDFYADNDHQSDPAVLGEGKWIKNYRGNLAQAFSFASVK